MNDDVDHTDKSNGTLRKDFLKGDLGSLDPWIWYGMTMSPQFWS